MASKELDDLQQVCKRAMLGKEVKQSLLTVELL